MFDDKGTDPGSNLPIMAAMHLTRILFCSALLVAAEIPAFAQVAQSADQDPGSHLYASNCAGCHGADGTGSSKGLPIATMRNVIALPDATLVAIVHNGVTAAGMPAFPRLSDEETKAVVRYLRTLQGQTSAPAAAAATGDTTAGREVFFAKGHCAGCHMISGEGGFIASDLTTYGQSRAANVILRAIVAPDAQLAPGSRVVEVSTNAGEKLSGMARSEDNLHITLQTEDGRYHFLTRSELAQVNYTDHSLMPHDYGTRLTATELNNLVGFLITTGKSAPPEPVPTGRGRRGGGGR